MRTQRPVELQQLSREQRDQFWATTAEREAGGTAADFRRAANAVTVVDAVTHRAASVRSATARRPISIRTSPCRPPTSRLHTACANCHWFRRAFCAGQHGDESHGLHVQLQHCHGSGKGPFYGTPKRGRRSADAAAGTVARRDRQPYSDRSADCAVCHSATTQGGFKITATPSLSASARAVASVRAGPATTLLPRRVSGLVRNERQGAARNGRYSGRQSHALGSGDCKTATHRVSRRRIRDLQHTVAGAAGTRGVVGELRSCHGTARLYGVASL